jgi:hypothetical protein
MAGSVPVLPTLHPRTVSSQYVGASPRGRPLGQVQDLPLPRFIEKIPRTISLLKLSSAASRSIGQSLWSCATSQQAVAHDARLEPGFILLTDLLSLLLAPV